MTNECDKCRRARDERERKQGAYWLTPEGRAEIRETWDGPRSQKELVPTLLDEVERLEAIVRAPLVLGEGTDAPARAAHAALYGSVRSLATDLAEIATEVSTSRRLDHGRVYSAIMSIVHRLRHDANTHAPMPAPVSSETRTASAKRVWPIPGPPVAGEVFWVAELTDGHPPPAYRFETADGTAHGVTFDITCASRFRTRNDCARWIVENPMPSVAAEPREHSMVEPRPQGDPDHEVKP